MRNPDVKDHCFNTIVIVSTPELSTSGQRTRDNRTDVIRTCEMLLIILNYQRNAIAIPIARRFESRRTEASEDGPFIRN